MSRTSGMGGWKLDVFQFLSEHRRVFALLNTAVLSAVGYGAALLLGSGLTPGTVAEVYLATAAIPVGLKLAGDLAFGLSHQRWRYAGTSDFLRVFQAMGAASVVFAVLVLVTPFLSPVGWGTVVLDFVFASYFVGGVRFAYRVLYDRLRTSAVTRELDRDEARRILVVGAGEAGYRVGREMAQFPEYRHRLVGFIDDDPDKIGARIRGYPVLGDTASIKKLVREYGIDGLIIAIPSASPGELREIVARCNGCGVPISILPPAREILEEDRIRLGQVREITIEDLLARPPIHFELPELRHDLRGESVLVTGAGGSIGSELARQVALHEPQRLILLDQAESNLYFLQRELEDDGPSCDIVPVVGDILDESRLRSVFHEHAPTRVFHAAAYKHVPIMESNPDEAVRNNTLGTWRVSRAAGETSVEKLVLVSTDKAVEPKNIMGASKRMAEQVILAAQDQYPETAFTAVRFGNVLGSQGSVVPLFKKQLAEGRPLTVTHPEASRFFMTIEEAVQLVLQASLLPESRGRITMLDMGEPVQILELAKSMLRIAGVNGKSEDRIEIIGLRPGEKLHEELVGPGEETVPTKLEKIRLLEQDRSASSRDILELVTRWEAVLNDGNRERLVSEVWQWCRGPREERVTALARA